MAWHWGWGIGGCGAWVLRGTGTCSPAHSIRCGVTVPACPCPGLGPYRGPQLGAGSLQNMAPTAADSRCPRHAGQGRPAAWALGGFRGHVEPPAKQPQYKCLRGLQQARGPSQLPDSPATRGHHFSGHRSLLWGVHQCQAQHPQQGLTSQPPTPMKGRGLTRAALGSQPSLPEHGRSPAQAGCFQSALWG